MYLLFIESECTV